MKNAKLFFICLSIGLTALVSSVALAQSSETTIRGFAWASNVGWINFGNGVDNAPKVLVNTSRILSGYAWSSNLGWIKFDPSLAGPAVAGNDCPMSARLMSSPVAGCIQSNSLAVVPATQVNGWARVCSVFQSNCTGNLRPDADLGGWDGWLKMANVKLLPQDSTNPLHRFMDGFAWGSLNLGWVNMALQASVPTNTPTPPPPGCVGDNCGTSGTPTPTPTGTPTPTPTPTVTVTPTVTPVSTPPTITGGNGPDRNRFDIPQTATIYPNISIPVGTRFQPNGANIITAVIWDTVLSGKVGNTSGCEVPILLVGGTNCSTSGCSLSGLSPSLSIRIKFPKKCEVAATATTPRQSVFCQTGIYTGNTITTDGGSVTFPINFQDCPIIPQ